jgi:UDP-N-acetylmuramyl pentapeptide synthase
MTDSITDADSAMSDGSVNWEEARRRRLRWGGSVVGVTGSCGKTTTKDLITTVLRSRYRGRMSEGSLNCGADLVPSLLNIGLDDQFLVQELGAWGPGTLDAGIDLMRPDVAVVLNLRNDHYSAFHGSGGAQAEKGKLVAALPPGGTAVLNRDDPLVSQLSSYTAATTLTFGQSAQAQLRARDVVARWPEPLSFRVTYRGQRAHVRTQLLAEHLLGSALAALAVGLVFEIPLAEAVDALETARPTFRRLSPAVQHDGVAFIRDDYKAPADSFPEVLAFMRNAEAARKLAVIGRIADFPGRSRPTYTRIAWEAMRALDTVIFVGNRAAELWGAQHSTAPVDQWNLRRRLAASGGDIPADSSSLESDTLGDMLVFETVREADCFLRDYLISGDLVLLKGSGPADHLERVLLSRAGPVACWTVNCGKTHCCDTCASLRTEEPLTASYALAAPQSTSSLAP